MSKPVPIFVQAFKLLIRLSTFWASLIMWTVFGVWAFFEFGESVSNYVLRCAIVCTVYVYCVVCWAYWKRQKMEKDNELG